MRENPNSHYEKASSGRRERKGGKLTGNQKPKGEGKTKNRSQPKLLENGELISKKEGFGGGLGGGGIRKTRGSLNPCNHNPSASVQNAFGGSFRT